MLGLRSGRGMGVGYGVSVLLQDAAAASAVTSVRDTWTSLSEKPAIAIGLAFAGVVVVHVLDRRSGRTRRPMVFGALLGKSSAADPANSGKTSD